MSVRLAGLLAQRAHETVSEEVSGVLSVPNKPSGFCGRKAIFIYLLAGCIYASVCLSAYLSVCLSFCVCLCDCVPAYVSVYVFVYVLKETTPIILHLYLRSSPHAG